MALNFVETLPQDGVQPRSGHTETARELRANPTATGWADVTKDGGYSKRATATAAAKEINDHTHPAYRDYGFEAVVRSVNVLDAQGNQVYEKDDKSGKNVAKQTHTLYARYNPTLPQAGTLAPEVAKKPRKKSADANTEVTSAPVAADENTGGADAPAESDSAVSLPAMGQADAPAPVAAARPAARAKK